MVVFKTSVNILVVLVAISFILSNINAFNMLNNDFIASCSSQILLFFLICALRFHCLYSSVPVCSELSLLPKQSYSLLPEEA